MVLELEILSLNPGKNNLLKKINNKLYHTLISRFCEEENHKLIITFSIRLSFYLK
jgi:hypothetical protein